MSKVEFRALSKQGTYHSLNQDSLATPTDIEMKLLQEKGYLFVVCDGVGGYEGGEVASKYCCTELLKAYYQEDQTDDIVEWFKKQINTLNDQIIKKGAEFNLHKMSTTLTALLIKDDTAYTFNIGDSRIYLYKNSQLIQLTDDDSVIWQQYEKNLIEKDDIVNSSIKNLITQAIGFEHNITVSTKVHKLPEKYCFLMCSDGLTDVSIDDELELVFTKKYSLKQIIDKLYKISRENSSHDDVSIIVASNYLEK